MKKVSLLLILTLFVSIGTRAEKISEKTAYEIAELFFTGNGQVTKQLSPENQTLRLVHTSTGYYAFNRGEKAGFVLVAADNRVSHEVLGYADNGEFDTATMPDNMRWWLSEYDREINAITENNTQVSNRLFPAMKDYPVIDPLLQSKWNQDSPYNDQCPTYNGIKCPSGCVATAMAQILYYHKYPEVGVGTNSYEWSVNGISQGTLSADFSQHSYNYDAMKDTYDESSSTASRQAVAQLMSDVGIAVNMEYGPYESGAYSYIANQALVKHFNYDKSAILYNRDYYSYEEWTDMLYASLAASCPVYYSGSNESGGHAFVCDGYNDGYFHINWGWGGYSDGYFLITALDPAQQGIGGSSAGYNFYQSAIFNLQRPRPDSDYVQLFYCGTEFDITEKELTNSSTATFIGGYYNYGISNQDITMGLKVVNEANVVTWVESYYTGMLDPYYGFNKYEVDLSGFPTENGNYLVYPAYRDNVTEAWHEIPTPLNTSKRYLSATVSGSDILFENPQPMSYDRLSITNILPSSYAYEEKNFTTQVYVTNTGDDEFYGSLSVALVTPGTNTAMAISGEVLVNLPADASTELSFSMIAPEAGEYELLVIGSDGTIISERTPITIQRASSGTLDLSLAGPIQFIPTGSEHLGELNFTVQVTCNSGFYEGYIGIAIFPGNGGSSIDMKYQNFYINAGETKQINFNDTFAGIENNKSYLAGVFYFHESNWEQIGELLTFTVTDETIPEELTLSISDPITIQSQNDVPMDNIELSAQITCESGSFEGIIGIAFYTEDGTRNIDLKTRELYISAGESETITYSGTFKEMEYGQSYLVAIFYYFNDEWIQLSAPAKFTVKPLSAIGEIKTDATPEHIVVYNLSGVRVHEQDGELPLNLSTLPDGIYIVKSGTTVKRIIKN